MKNTLQGRNEIVINAPVEKVWGIVADSALLPRWTQMVTHTTGKKESVGSVRECDVEMDGRKGHVAERCIECVERQQISWIMEKDSMGFLRMFPEFKFGFILEPRGLKATRVVSWGAVRPGGVFSRVMYALMMKRKFQQLRQNILERLKQFAEST